MNKELENVVNLKKVLNKLMICNFVGLKKGHQQNYWKTVACNLEEKRSG